MPPKAGFDLQSHSHHSDGSLSPTEVVRAAAETGVTLLALTDHDSVAGVREATDAGQRHGVTVVAAAELSALHEGQEDLHILGYGFDPVDPRLLGSLERYQADRSDRAGRMAGALREAGLALEASALDQRRREGRSIGRPHLAQAVFAHPDNAPRLRREGLRDPSQVLEAYLLPGRPGYRGRTLPGVHEAIDVIHAAGGVAVWAHPFWDIDAPERVQATLRRFAGWGIDGVEAFYVTHHEWQTRLLAQAAAELDLLTTGSSDFHGPEHSRFSRFLAFSLYDLQPRLGPLADMA